MSEGKWSWVLSVEEDGASSSMVIRFGLSDPESGKTVYAPVKCGSPEELAKEIALVKEELDGLVARASAELEKLGKGGGKAVAPDAIWKELEQLASDQDMFSRYNALSEKDRAAVAEYVFSHVNMFKGKGVVFAEHYNNGSHILE